MPPLVVFDREVLDRIESLAAALEGDAIDFGLVPFGVWVCDSPSCGAPGVDRALLARCLRADDRGVTFVSSRFFTGVAAAAAYGDGFTLGLFVVKGLRRGGVPVEGEV